MDPSNEQRVIRGLIAIFRQLETQNQLLERIALATEKLAANSCTSREAPNFTYPLESFPQFDWASIGAVVERCDEYGPAIILWQGQTFTRRSPQNRYGEVIFYSRCVGKDGQGNNAYERLITFKRLPQQVEPLPDRTARLIVR